MEAEIYATDECTKALLTLSLILTDLELLHIFMKAPTKVYNDNASCVVWNRNQTTKGARHIQIRENASRESVQNGFIDIQHIAGKMNISNIFTKEEKDIQGFLSNRDVIVVENEDSQISNSSISQKSSHVPDITDHSPYSMYRGVSVQGTCPDRDLS